MTTNKQRGRKDKRGRKIAARQKKSRQADRSDAAYRKFIAAVPKPKGRFNKWGEKKWIAPSDEKLEAAARTLKEMKLSRRARALFEAAFYTDSPGVDFVFMSNAQLLNYVTFNNGVQIVPCFFPIDYYNLQPGIDDARHSAMLKSGNYIYDGWVPAHNWSQNALESIVSKLDDLVNLFSIVERYHASWEPKYDFSKPPIQTHWIFPADIKSLQQTIDILENLNEGDRQALRLGSAWVADALKDESPIQRFLLLFISLESLITYIERKAEKDSPLKVFAASRLSKDQRRGLREDCIDHIWKDEANISEAVKRAYFECVQTNRRMMEEHLDRVFEDSSVATKLFKEEVDGKTLWELRNDIAHGSINILTEAEVFRTARSLDIMENIARSYLRIIISKIASEHFFNPTRRPGFVLPAATHAIGEPGSKSTSPTDMAELYGNLEALSSSYVSSKHGQSVRFRI